eukprot:c23214_g1_i1 orf=384-2192(-)
MGVELVLSLRLPPLNGAFAYKSPLERASDLPRRRQSAVAADARGSGYTSNHEGYSDSRFHSSLDNHQLQQQHHQHHHQHQQFHHQPHYNHHHHPQQSQHHPWQGSLDVGWSLDIGCHPGRLGSGFSIAAESDSGDKERQEHAHCTSSFLHNAICSSPSKGDQITADHVCAGAAVAGVDLPLSLRMLKRKQQDLGKSTLASGLSEVGNSLLNAFSSVVSMMKALQTHTLQIRRHFFEQEIEGLLGQVQREMHVSFLWLFQQVFSCTPELMVLVMVLLADFTAFSMANNMPSRPPISLYTPPMSTISTLSNSMKSSDEGLRAYINMSFTASPSVVDKAEGFHNDGGWFGNGGRRTYHIAGGADGDHDPYNTSMNLSKAPYSLDGNLPIELSSTAAVSVASHEFSACGLTPNDFAGEDATSSDFAAMAAALAFEELGTAEDVTKSEDILPAMTNDVVDHVQAVGGAREAVGDSRHLVLDQETMWSLVAPFSAKIEDDDYSCYDRTDLAYQDAISSDSMNSMLLANYAQFLFLVRKDHDRAEELFRKAVLCDPFDSDAISRFASFLWLARHNVIAAEKAYQAALRADPTNSSHAANYAHFLWNSGL